MNVPRLQIPPRLLERMSYDKLAGAVPRILVLESGYWLDIACINAARTLGWDIRTLPVPLEGVLPMERVHEMLNILIEFRPDFVLTINLGAMDVGGLFARLLEDLRLPYVTWFVDDPRTIIMDRTTYASPYAVALTWERAYIPYLMKTGFTVTRYLPLAVDPTVFYARPGDEALLPPTFVGNSMVVPAENEWTWVRQRSPELAEGIAHALDSAVVTRQRFAEGIDSLLPGELLQRLDEDEKRHAEILFFVDATKRLRREAALAWANAGAAIRGDDEWCAVVPHAGAAVNYQHDLPRLYAQCPVNLNITSVQMATAVNQRVFDCPAAGGFLLTDAQSDLFELFDVGKEAVCYNSLDESVEMMQWFQARPDARRQIIASAQRRIAGEHTYAHRLQSIVAILSDLFC